MKCFVGIDIGAISATAAVIAGDLQDPPRSFTDNFPVFHRLFDGWSLYCSTYRRTHGRPVAAGTEILEQLIASLGERNIAGVCLTGSGSKLVAGKLGASVTNEFRAIASGLAVLGVKVRTVFEMGGESSKYLSLRDSGEGSYSIVDYATNGDCAAGTGSFIDQQANRLRYSVEQIGPLVLEADRAAQVAGRCSVFAKSDMIHAQQKGYSPAEVLRGLCNAVARNFKSAVVRSHPVAPPVAFVGGVAANSAVVRAMAETFELDEGQLVVPPNCAHVPAVGAAVLARARGGANLSGMSDLRSASDLAHGKFPTNPPLNLDDVLLLGDRIEPYEPDETDGPIDVFLGIDIGSVSTNVVMIDSAGRVVHEIYTSTMGRPIEVVAEALNEIRRRWDRRLNVRGVGTTGSGRELIGQLVGADTINDEITAHKTGSMFVGKTMLGGQVPDTIFEIGGQDSKFISLQDGVVVDFTMNEACAAGTGSFLEERAEELEIAIKDEFAALALSSSAPIRLGERCTVFMERDVNSYMQRGAEKADLVAGLAYSVVYNYINRVVRGRRIGECIFFQGGTAYNNAVAAAFAGVLGKQIIVPPHNGVIGAIGSALLAKEKMAHPLENNRSLGTYISRCESAAQDPQAAPPAQPTKFRGYDISRVNHSLREFTCKGCSNDCQIQEFTVEGDKTYWGDKCSDRFRKRAQTFAEPVIEDLFALRTCLLLDESDLPPADKGASVVGIPLSMFAYQQMHFWRTLLAGCGYRTVLSDATNKKIIQAGLESAVAEPCFPLIAAHGHVLNLLEKGVDYILLPNVISQQTPWMHTESHLCPWHQTLPFVVRRSPAIEPYSGRILTPQAHFRQGRQFVSRELSRFFSRLGIAPRRFARAMERAFAAQDRFNLQILQAGDRAMAKLLATGAHGIIIVGRPYNIHDPALNLSVASKLRRTYGANCVPIDFLDTDPVDIRDINESMYWDLGRRIIAAAKLIAPHPNLHLIYFTNFKCGPDSFIKHYVKPASGKPFLSLQFDGHSNDAGIMTRCEAYLDSKGILRSLREQSQPARQLARRT